MIPCLDDAEEIKTDIASARETFTDASVGSTRYPGSSIRSWTKSQRVKYVPPPSHALAIMGPTLLTVHIHCYAQALGVVDVGSLLVELSERIGVRNGRPSCRASQGQNHSVRHGYRGSKEVRQSA